MLRRNRCSRYLSAAAFVVVVCLMVSAASVAADPAPIVGRWQMGSAVIQVTGSGGGYQGVIYSGGYGCAKRPGEVVWQLSGSGFNYSGSAKGFDADTCKSLGMIGSSTWTLSDETHMVWHNDYGGGNQFDAALVKVGPPAPLPPKTNCKRNGKRVLCPAQRKVVDAADASAHKTLPPTKGFKKAGDHEQSERLSKLARLSKKAKPRVAEWRRLKLPETAKQAKAQFTGVPNADRLGKLLKQQLALSAFAPRIARIAERAAAEDPKVKDQLDEVAHRSYYIDFELLDDYRKAHCMAVVWDDPPVVHYRGVDANIDPQTGHWVVELGGVTANATGSEG